MTRNRKGRLIFCKYQTPKEWTALKQVRKLGNFFSCGDIFSPSLTWRVWLYWFEFNRSCQWSTKLLFTLESPDTWFGLTMIRCRHKLRPRHTLQGGRVVHPALCSSWLCLGWPWGNCPSWSQRSPSLLWEQVFRHPPSLPRVLWFSLSSRRCCSCPQLQHSPGPPTWPPAATSVLGLKVISKTKCLWRVGIPEKGASLLLSVLVKWYLFLDRL